MFTRKQQSQRRVSRRSSLKMESLDARMLMAGDIEFGVTGSFDSDVEQLQLDQPRLVVMPTQTGTDTSGLPSIGNQVFVEVAAVDAALAELQPTKGFAGMESEESDATHFPDVSEEDQELFAESFAIGIFRYAAASAFAKAAEFEVREVDYSGRKVAPEYGETQIKLETQMLPPADPSKLVSMDIEVDLETFDPEDLDDGEKIL